MDVIIRNARKLQRLTDDILDINRIETNSFHIRYEQTLTDQSRDIIESNKNIKPILDKIDDLANDIGEENEEVQQQGDTN